MGFSSFGQEKGMWLLAVAKDCHLPLQLSRMQFLPGESNVFWFHYRASQHTVIVAIGASGPPGRKDLLKVAKCDIESIG